MEKNRILPIQSGLNLRELGGYPTKDGKTVRWQKLLRSGYLSVLKKDDQLFLTDYGLRYDVDLRSDYEIARNPDPQLPHVTHISASVYPFAQHTSLGFKRWLKRLFHRESQPVPSVLSDPYQLMVLDTHAQSAFKKLFQAMLANDQPNQSVLFHCAAGKDRTGVAGFLVLSALGVDQDTIEEDYLLSNRVLFGTHTPVTTTTTHNAALDKMNEARNVNLRSLRLAKKAIEDTYGNIENYLHKAMKLTDADLKQIRDLYTI